MNTGYGAAREAGYEKQTTPPQTKMPEHAMGMAQAILSRLGNQCESLETLDGRLRCSPRDPEKDRANPTTLLDLLEMILDRVNWNSRLVNEIAAKIGD